jgi:hypothetical protein
MAWFIWVIYINNIWFSNDVNNEALRALLETVNQMNELNSIELDLRL